MKISFYASPTPSFPSLSDSCPLRESVLLRSIFFFLRHIIKSSSSSSEPEENNMKPQNLTPMNLLSQQVAYRPHLSIEEIPILGNSSVIKPVTKEPKGAQLTIFYAGEVIVFDDFPADKANDIMSFASKEISQRHNSYAYPFAQSQSSFPPNVVRSSASSGSPFPFNVNIIPNTGNNLVQDPQAPSRPVVCDLPLTRKASLYRFLEKRKDRIAARAPYQTSNPMTAPYKPAESMSWFALVPQSPQDKSESCSSFM